MPVGLYMDHNVHGAIAAGLRRRGVDVLTSAEDGTNELIDPDLLDRATALDRVLFTNDDDLLAEAARRQAVGIPVGGVIYTHQDRLSDGQCIAELELIAVAGEPEALRDRVTSLPI